MTITVVVATLFLVLGMRRSTIVPGRLQVAVELSYEFIAGLARHGWFGRPEILPDRLHALHVRAAR